MDPLAQALAFVEPYCDIAERLRAIPAEAQVRGVLFRSITGMLERADKLASYGARFGTLRYESLALYPLSDYMIRLASAGAFLATPETLYEGMGEISRVNAREMTASLLGQTLLHALASEPRSVISQGLAMRRQTFGYGRWELVDHGPRHVEVHYFDEYVWIEQSHAQAAAGMFESCSVKPIMTTTLESPYRGSTQFRW